MLNFMTIPPANDNVAQMIKRRLEEHFKAAEGVCYYKHGMAKTANNVFPDFTVFTKTNQPLVIKIVPYQINKIEFVDDETWIANNIIIESPAVLLEDLTVKIENQFRNERKLRNILKPQSILAFPFIVKKDFEGMFGSIQESVHILWAGSNSRVFHYPLENPLSDEEWTQTRAVIQGVTNLHRTPKSISSNITTLNDAIRELD